MRHTDHTATPADDTAATRPAGPRGLAAWRGVCALPLAAVAILLSTPAAADPPHARQAEARAAHAANEAAKSPYKLLHVFDKRSDASFPTTKLTVGPDGYMYGISEMGGSNGYGAAYRASVTGETTVIYNFGSTHRFGTSPTSAPVFGSDGAIYGLSYVPWPFGSKPSIFRLTLDGGFTLLNKLPYEVSMPVGDLIRARDGYFYGVSYGSGPCGVNNICEDGRIFRFNEAGEFTTLHIMNPDQGRSPSGGLLEGSDGNLYGMTNWGGASNKGSVYKITPQGVHTVLHQFTGAANDGSRPTGELVQAPNGLYYGMTSSGGAFNKGTVFSIDSAGNVSVVYSFTGGADGSVNTGHLLAAPDGWLYGVFEYGGPNGGGRAFRVSTTGVYEPIYAFGRSAGDGAKPHGALTVGPNGLLYGTTYGGGTNDKGTLYQVNAAAALQTIHSFDPDRIPNGYNPTSAVLFASDGYMYGTTDAGSVYRMTGKNQFQTLHEPDPMAGSLFKGDLIEMAPGVLLGTAKTGGAHGKGTVFKMTLDGTLTVLHAFSGVKGDGAEPHGGLVKALDGNFYGTTTAGGAGGMGTVYRLRPTGEVDVIWSFNGAAPGTGIKPIGTLALGPDGALYGVTQGDGLYPTDWRGSVYKITTAGEFTRLYQLDRSRDGTRPSAGLTLASNGLFYGVTSEDGPGSAWGSIFSVSPAGEFRTLHAFASFAELGTGPMGALMQARDGFLYGTTRSSDYGAGDRETGVIFRMGLDGPPSRVHTLYSKEGAAPQSRLVQGPDGALYGTTIDGGKRTTRGADGEGVVFRLDIGAGPRLPTRNPAAAPKPR